MNEICPEGFRHYIQSVRVVEVLEKNGLGLNLTKEVRDGMMNHSTSRMPKTLEGQNCETFQTKLLILIMI